MPWLRAGDTSAMYPKLLSVVMCASFDERLINEVAGFLFRCSTQAACYITDYVVDVGTAYSIGAGRTAVLTDACVEAGLMEIVDLGGVRGWKIIDDPEFLHMKTEEEINWEKQRKADNGNPALIIPVRLRDGDACRYCGKVVNWRARKGKLHGTYDHRVPGEAGTVDTLVVACGACNAARGNDPDADKRVPLLPPPDPVYFHKSTIEWINTNSWARDNGMPLLEEKKDKFVPAGSVPRGHERHVPVPEELFERPVEPNPGSQPAANGSRSTVEPSPGSQSGVYGSGESVEPSPDGQSGVYGSNSMQTTAPPLPQWISNQVDSAAEGSQPPHPQPTTQAARPSAHAQRPTDNLRRRDAASKRATAPPLNAQSPPVDPDPQSPETPRPAETPDLPKKSDPADRECTTSGKVGSGRDGSGRDGKVRNGTVTVTALWTVRLG